MAGSDLVQVSPKERIRRNPGESDADVRRRWAAEERASDERTRKREEDSRFYKRRSKAGPIEQLDYDLERAAGRRFAKGGSTASKRADGCATKGKTKGKIV